MYVCLCKGITDKQIADLVKQGHDTCKEIGKQCGAGTDCTSCCKQIQEIIGRVIRESAG